MGVTTMSCHSRGSAPGRIARHSLSNDSGCRATKFRQDHTLQSPHQTSPEGWQFPGVTVEHHTGYVRDANGEEIALIDLPGVYSLTPKSEDEKVAVDVLTGKMPGTPAPDAVILVLNSTNLHTHLVLAARVIALGCLPWCC